MCLPMYTYTLHRHVNDDDRQVGRQMKELKRGKKNKKEQKKNNENGKFSVLCKIFYKLK